MSEIQYPVGIKDTGRFEHQNNINVNVYGYEDKKNLPVTYYHFSCCKTSREFIRIIRIGERLEQTGIKSI